MKKIALSIVLLICSTALSAQWEKALPELMHGEITQVIKGSRNNNLPI